MAKKKQMEYIRDAWAPFNAMNEPRHTQTPACPIKKEKWIHDNKELLFGSVMYKVKFLGIVDSETCEDRLTVEEAFRELKRKGINKSTDVEMSISVRAVIVTEVKSKIHMCKYKLQKIAYCSDPDDKTFAFIVKKGDNVHQCYCFETQHSSRKITLTIGQAFSLAWERFQEAKSASEDFVGEMKKIKAKRGKEDYIKKLAELHQQDSEDHGIFPDPNHPRLARRTSNTALLEQWHQLQDTVRVLRDEDEMSSLFQQSNESDFDKAFESLQNEIDEWSNARSPYQSDLEVYDALKEFDSALGSSDSTSLLTDSQIKLPQFQTKDESTDL